MYNQKELFVPRENVTFLVSYIFWCYIPSPGFQAVGVVLNLSYCDIKFIPRDVPREPHAPRTTLKNGGSEHE